MCGRKVNAEIEQRTRAPPDGLKRVWEGARLPAVPDHQARALDPLDFGRRGCQVDARQASTRAKSPGSWTTRSTSLAYTERTSCSSSSHSTNPVNLLQRRQRKGSIARVYSWPEMGDPCRTPHPKLTGSVRVQLSLTRHSAEVYSTWIKPTNWGPKTKARRVPRRYLWSTLSNAFSLSKDRRANDRLSLHLSSNQKQVVKDAVDRDGVGLIWVDHVCQHGP
ncbi:unnamed protein product [Caretta caretta]